MVMGAVLLHVCVLPLLPVGFPSNDNSSRKPLPLSSEIPGVRVCALGLHRGSQHHAVHGHIHLPQGLGRHPPVHLSVISVFVTHRCIITLRFSLACVCHYRLYVVTIFLSLSFVRHNHLSVAICLSLPSVCHYHLSVTICRPLPSVRHHLSVIISLSLPSDSLHLNIITLCHYHLTVITSKYHNPLSVITIYSSLPSVCHYLGTMMKKI